MGGGYAWAQQHRFPFTEAMATVECPICQEQRPTLSPWYDTIPWGDQPATWWQVDYTRPFLSWKGQHFVLTVIDTLDMDVHSLYAMFLSKLPSMDLKDALSTSMVLHTALLVIKELTSQQKKCNDGPKLTEFTSLTMFPNILEANAWQTVECLHGDSSHSAS